jgi:hypothetical protein
MTNTYAVLYDPKNAVTNFTNVGLQIQHRRDESRL